MLQSYLEELRKTPLLEPDEERALWERVANGDLEAHKCLMTAYQPLVFKIATSFRLGEAETLELIQEGMVGLLEAAENYDYTRQVAFSLFASYRIWRIVRRRLWQMLLMSAWGMSTACRSRGCAVYVACCHVLCMTSIRID